MEYVILGLLLMADMSLYELNHQFKQGISLFYSASLGSLQKALAGLLSKGWVTCTEVTDKGRHKKIYAITPAGQEAFGAWMDAGIPIQKLGVVALSKVFFLGYIEDPAHRRRILQEMLAKVDQVLADLTATEEQINALTLPPEYAAIFHYQRKTLTYGIGAHRFARDWCRQMLAELDADAS